MHPHQPNPHGQPPQAQPNYGHGAARQHQHAQPYAHQPAAAAAPVQAPPPVESGGRRGGGLELVIDKFVDFILIFVGLYAATAVQRCQDTAREKKEYASLLGDFKRELKANLEQEAAISKDLGAIEETEPGKNLGPMQATFKHFFEELGEDERVVACLHEEFVVESDDAEHHATPECAKLYAQFDKSHSDEHEKKDDHAPTNSFNFQPVVLTPFYRHEVWQLYLADGVKTFRNKGLAVRIAEIYANATLIEAEIQDIESTYNDAFMKQVGRTAATDLELAEIVHDEEKQHRLSSADMTLLLHVEEAIKDEHYAALEVEHILELKVERMKKTVLTMREEIDAVQKAIDEELDSLGRAAESAESPESS